MRREAEHRFERDVAMKAAVVAKDEFIEVNVDVFAPQAVIRAQRPALHQRKSPMAPWQDDIGRHIADDARIMPIIARESRIGGVAIGDQRRARPERVSRYFAPLRLGLGLPALRSITSTAPATRILPAAPGSKKASPARKGISV